MVSKMICTIMFNEPGNSKACKEDIYQPGKLEPEGIKGPTQRNYQGFASGKNRVEKAVFLYNSLERIFDIGNFRHFAYCSAKIGVSFVGA